MNFCQVLLQTSQFVLRQVKRDTGPQTNRLQSKKQWLIIHISSCKSSSIHFQITKGCIFRYETNVGTVHTSLPANMPVCRTALSETSILCVSEKRAKVDHPKWFPSGPVNIGRACWGEIVFLSHNICQLNLQVLSTQNYHHFTYSTINYPI